MIYFSGLGVAAILGQSPGELVVFDSILSGWECGTTAKAPTLGGCLKQALMDFPHLIPGTTKWSCSKWALVLYQTDLSKMASF